jgi:hypothetical protein
MAYVQTQFEQFHNAIRLGRFDERTFRTPLEPLDSILVIF